MQSRMQPCSESSISLSRAILVQLPLQCLQPEPLPSGGQRCTRCTRVILAGVHRQVKWLLLSPLHLQLLLGLFVRAVLNPGTGLIYPRPEDNPTPSGSLHQTPEDSLAPTFLSHLNLCSSLFASTNHCCLFAGRNTFGAFGEILSARKSGTAHPRLHICSYFRFVAKVHQYLLTAFL